MKNLAQQPAAQQEKKLMLVLDWRHRIEKATREDLSHGGGQLLRALLLRMSIKRLNWVHGYCFLGDKSELSSKKKERLEQMSGDLAKLRERIELNSPCVTVALGKIPCEALVGSSILGIRAGTCWRTDEYGKVWVTYSPDAALFDPALTVSIYGVLWHAALSAGLSPKFDIQTRMFDWRSFMVYNRKKTYAVRNE